MKEVTVNNFGIDGQEVMVAVENLKNNIIVQDKYAKTRAIVDADTVYTANLEVRGKVAAYEAITTIDENQAVRIANILNSLLPAPGKADIDRHALIGKIIYQLRKPKNAKALTSQVTKSMVKSDAEKIVFGARASIMGLRALAVTIEGLLVDMRPNARAISIDNGVSKVTWTVLDEERSKRNRFNEEGLPHGASTTPFREEDMGKLAKPDLVAKPRVKMGKTQKETAKLISDVKLRVRRGQRELLKKAVKYHPSTVMNPDDVAEDPTRAILRASAMKTSLDIILEHYDALASKEYVYVSWRTDDRNIRYYPEMNAVGLSLHGTKIEKYMWQMATPHKVTKEGKQEAREYLAMLHADEVAGKKIMYVDAMKYYRKNRKEILAWKYDVVEPDPKLELSVSPAEVTKYAEQVKAWNEAVGMNLLIGDVQSYINARIGTWSHVDLAWDVSSSGVATYGSSTKNLKAMEAANMAAVKYVHDFHNTLREGVTEASGKDITRKETKKWLSNALVHGANVYGVAKNFSDNTGTVLTGAALNKALETQLGKSFQVIGKIADLTGKCLTGASTLIKFRGIDGEMHGSHAYITSQGEDKPLAVISSGFINSNDSGETTLEVTAPIPFVYDPRTGKLIKGLKATRAKSDTENVDPEYGTGAEKIKSLYASITHADETAIVDEIIRAVGDCIPTHDSFRVKPGMRGTISKAIKECHVRFAKTNPYAIAIKSIAKLDSSKAATEVLALMEKSEVTLERVIEEIEAAEEFLQP